LEKYWISDEGTTISNILSNGEVNPRKRELRRTEIIFWRKLDNYATNFTKNTQMLYVREWYSS